MSLTKLPGFTLDPTSNVTFANANVTGNLTSSNANLGNLVVANYYSGTGLTVTGNSTINNVSLTGNIIPNIANVYTLGNLTNYFKDAYIGPGSLYVNGKKVLEDVSGTINFTTDINQNLKVTTSGSGDILFDPTGTGVVSIKGPLQIETGINITSSDGNAIHFANPLGVDSITTHLANTDLSISANGTGTIRLNDDVVVSGNLTVSGTTTYINTETVQLYDNIIDLNSNFTTGSPTENAGVRVLRGDEAAVSVRWNESTDKWQYTIDGSTYVDIVGTTSLGATALGNAATANYFIGSGNNLSNIQGANVTGAVSYATTANSVAVANITGIGNISTINIDGNASNVLYGNGVFSTAPAGGAGGSYANSDVATFLASYGSNTISTTGNVTVGNIIGNGQSLTSINGANVTGAVAYATTANSVAVANVTGIGNIATINLDGNTSNILYGNGAFAAAPAGGGGGTTTNALTIGTGLSGTSFNGSSAVTIAIDSTVSTLTGSQTLTNKTLTSPTINNGTSNNLTLTGTLTAGGGVGTNGQYLQSTATGVQWATVSGGGSSTNITMIAVTDETSNITVSSSRMSFRAPTAMTLSAIPRASLATASTSGLVICDIKLNGTTILGVNKLSIDANELTSVTATTATTLVTTSIPDDGLITVDITSAGTGAKGLKITFYS